MGSAVVRPAHGRARGYRLRALLERKVDDADRRVARHARHSGVGKRHPAGRRNQGDEPEERENERLAHLAAYTKQDQTRFGGTSGAVRNVSA
jgi:hypothetical protein